MWLALVLGLCAAGLMCVGYGVFVERRWYRVRRYQLAILPAGATSISVLHLSDTHFVAVDKGKARFISGLPRPDVLILTGDFLGEPEAVETAVAALSPVRGKSASLFVLGSNDYFVPKPLNYFRYFSKRRKRPPVTNGRPDDLVRLLEADGWTDLDNRRTSLNINGVRVEAMGIDDAHIHFNDLRIAPRRDREAFGLAVTHSPDPAAELAACGYDLVVAGHTHGGQVRMPFTGALVSNGTIPTKLAMGMARLGPSYLHVSPGLGTSKYAPFRFLCRPEATLIELTATEVPRESQPAEPATLSKMRS